MKNLPKFSNFSLDKTSALCYYFNQISQEGDQMLVSQKCQYALRALFELGRRNGDGPVKIADIADAQAIPVRFLEVILNQLKQGGFVRSQRGNSGGYILDRPPENLTVGEVIRFVQGPVVPVECVLGKPKSRKCPFYGDCVFLPMWERVEKALAGVYDTTTIQDLVNQKARKCGEASPDYAI
jgi:Rrf2 family protein